MLGRVTFVLLLVSALLLLSHSSALTLPRVLSSHMVLQRDLSTLLWGKAAPNSSVTVTLDNDPQQRFTATANPAGNWSIALPPHPADPTAHQLSITGDSTTLTLTDVLFGDVFLCSGRPPPPTSHLPSFVLSHCAHWSPLCALSVA